MIGNVHFQGKSQGSLKGAQCHPQVEFSTELLVPQTYTQILQQKAKHILLGETLHLFLSLKV